MIAGVEPALIAGHLLLGELVLVLALLLAFSALDDLAVDLLFIRHVVWRRATGQARPQPLPTGADPQPMAIIVPAWDEAAVIGAMLTDRKSVV